MSEENIEELRKRLDNLEYKEIKPIKEEITSIKVNLAENSLLTKQNIEQNKNLSETMSILKETLLEICTSIKLTNKDTKSLADNVKILSSQVVTLDDKVDQKFDEIDKKVQCVDDKSKIDTSTIIKDFVRNWLGVGMGLGAIIYFIFQMIVK